MKLTASPAVNAPMVFSVNAASTENPPRLETVSPAGGHQPLTISEATTADGPAWEASFTPTKAGRWEVHATDAANHTVRVVFPVQEKPSSAELLNLPADLTGMNQLAEDTGGALVDNATGLQSPTEAAAKPP